MYKLKLIKGLSYVGYGVSAAKERPFIEVEEKDRADALVESGFFSAVYVPDETNNIDVSKKPFEKMTEKELTAYAAENGIDISGASKKGDKLAVILSAIAEDDENVPDYGEEQ